jgi:hypothetical protein
MARRLISRLIIVAIFSIAFAYIESAVVVYLRQIFHPDGFDFPLNVFGINQINARLFLTEIGREAATLILIITASVLFGKNLRQRFAYFLMIFAIWDIFYYVWLKVLIGWPASIMDWDILFLIPLTWASPVLAPVIVSLTLLLFALVILALDSGSIYIRPGLLYWTGFCGSGLLLVILFCYAGRFSAQADYHKHFSWPGFIIAEITAVSFFFACLFNRLPPKVTEKQIQ